MTTRPPEVPQRPASAPSRAEPRSAPTGPGGPIASESLFAGAREVLIEHPGSLYRLKQTALGKLILTK